MLTISQAKEMYRSTHRIPKVPCCAHHGGFWAWWYQGNHQQDPKARHVIVRPKVQKFMRSMNLQPLTTFRNRVSTLSDLIGVFWGCWMPPPEPTPSL